MAMYDWDGTTTYQLGKAYDWDGTASHQLGKGYDCDGTTNHLIYSAEETIFPPRTTTWIRSGVSTDSNANDERIYTYCNGSSQTNGQMYTTLDLTTVNTITFTATSGYGGNGFNAVTIDTVVYGSLGSARGISRPNGTYTIDVSDLTGTHKLYCCVWGSTGNSRITLTSLILS